MFLAEETALGRKVVVKVLPPEVGAELSMERFTREIRMAASLQQANIVPVLTAGEMGDLPYYTMPYVEGQSLRSRIATSGAQPLTAVVNILRDIARALDYAHEHGVIHRDIKPENILLSGAAAVVTDFGIAKAISASRPAMGSATLTSAGVVIGTPAYMSPEQAVGDPSIDHRADIYAFGCIAYELISGVPPFANSSMPKLLAAHISEVPRGVETLRADVPATLARLVAQCLAKDPAQRPQSAREILEVLDRVTTSRGSRASLDLMSSPGRSWKLAAWAGGVLVALVVAGMAWSRFSSHSGAPRTLAVMPFANIGGDSAQEYFSDGIAVDLTNALSKVAGLQVTSRSLAFAFKGKPIDVRAVGRQLGVDALLEASVQRVGARLRVTAQLTRTADGVTIWSNKYERDARDVFGVQDEITKSIVDELRPALSGQGATQARQANVAGTTNFDAYNSYLRGVYLLEHRGAGVTQAVVFFKDAIAKDTTFARAYGMLSQALELMPYFSSTSAVSVEEEAVNAAHTALRLDSTVVDAHVGLALARDHAFRWKEGEQEFRAALALDPNNSTTLMQWGRHLMHLGRIDEAMDAFHKSVKADPLNGTAFVWLAHTMTLAGRHDSAVVFARIARTVDPGLVLTRTINAKDAIEAGNRTLAVSLATGVEAIAPWRGQAVYVLAKGGDTTRARAIYRDLDHLRKDTWLVHTALTYAALGFADTSRALAELEAALAARETTPKWETFSDRMFDPVRSSPRFIAVVHGFNVDDRVLGPTGGRPKP
ncbi:MAG: protein kinase [Gemmatimonadaceae bacterium]